MAEKCPKCGSSEHVGVGTVDYCCHECRFFWPKHPVDQHLIQHIMGEMRNAPGRYEELQKAMRGMSIGALRDLHRLLRELNSNTNRAKRNARMGLIR